MSEVKHGIIKDEKIIRGQCVRIVSAAVDTLPDQFENNKRSGEFQVLKVKQDMEKLLKLYKLGLIDPDKEFSDRLVNSTVV